MDFCSSVDLADAEKLLVLTLSPTVRSPFGEQQLLLGVKLN